MIYFKNGRLNKNGMSFAVPDGFYLDTNAEEAREDGVRLMSFDEVYTVELLWEETEMEAWEELNDILDDGEFQVVFPIATVTVNGLKGAHATYHSGGYGYYELRLDIKTDENESYNFVVLICTDKKGLIDQICQRREVQELINSIRLN